MPHKRLLTILYAAISLIAVSLSMYISKQYLNFEFGILYAVICFIVGLVFGLIGKKIPFAALLSIMITSIGLGFSIHTYYHFKVFSLSFLDYFTAYATSLSVLALFGYLSHHRFFIKHAKIWLGITIIISFTVSLLLWLNVAAFNGLTFYYLNIIYFFMIAMIAASEDINDLNHEIAITLLGAFIVVTLIVFAIITEGEALDIGSADFLSISGNKKKKTPK